MSNFILNAKQIFFYVTVCHGIAQNRGNWPKWIRMTKNCNFLSQNAENDLEKYCPLFLTFLLKKYERSKTLYKLGGQNMEYILSDEYEEKLSDILWTNELHIWTDKYNIIWDKYSKKNNRYLMMEK